MIVAADFIRQNLRLEPVSGLPGIKLYTAHPASRLSRLADPDDADPPAPYWAYCWAGGMALAQHIASHPKIIARRRVLDLGAGSGLVGIAAAQAGAKVVAAEIDSHARVAIGLNAAANGVEIGLVEVDLAAAPPADVEVILAGDVFYNAKVAALMLPFLQRCNTSGIKVLIGDPGRRDLPLDRLAAVASYAVGDVGDARMSADRVGSVYTLISE